MSTRLHFRIFITLVLVGCMFISRASAQDNFNLAQQADQFLQEGGRQLKNNNFQEALTSFQSARSMYTQIAIPANNKQAITALQTRMSRILAMMAVSYQGLEDSTRAGDYAQRALTLGKQINDKFTIYYATQVLSNLNRTNKPDVVSRPQVQTDTCSARCNQQHPNEALLDEGAGPFLDCLEACQGRIGNYTKGESRDRQLRDDRHRTITDEHNKQCQDKYNSGLAHGSDSMSGALSYSHCVQY